ncbi:hypothetical protein EPUS_07078 [Endocarpon pusillum Z07020]|uniref:Uncharacterized protein n=1 Tax=Endocarpon pusillum (strain Z07020 / HMAS-L-300199) TaxID=1263415 RepID=U1GW98_ENDPU|nr:uncharacterized protein EPUS_07078 [Endocarpon pusillum Z07020]ERF76371.1 hypothetical protein EPUS_07078 [Endocarpon pusillum Z07020]
MLLESGANVNAPRCDGCGRTALQKAAERGHIQIIETLVEYGADVNAPPSRKYGLTALQAAATTHIEETFPLLIHTSVEVNAPPRADGERTAIQAAADYPPRGGADVNGPISPKNGTTALHEAVICGPYRMVLLLLDAGAHLDALDTREETTTPLMCAVEFDRPEMVQIILDANADVNLRTSKTELQFAVENQNLHIIQKLFLVGADANNSAENSTTPLQEFSMRHPDSFRIFHQHLIDDHATFRSLACEFVGSPSLLTYPPCTGIQAFQVRLVDTLIEAGADVNAPPSSKGGRTALQASAERGDVRMVEHLLSKGADIDASPAEVAGRTALQAAVAEGSANLVRLLLENGADVNAVPSEKGGQSALAAVYGTK